MKKNKCSLLPFIREDISGLSPNDSQFYGWEIKKFDIPTLWKKSTGKNIVVGVVDTGCDLNHPDIKNNLLEGKNFINTNSDPMDDNGHGTHISGTIAGENNGFGMVGIAPDAKIRPIKCLNAQGSGSASDIANGITWAADQRCDFISLSLGLKGISIPIRNSIDYAINKGCVVFCAAGNDGINTPIMFPSNYEKTISIGAIDQNLNRTSFSCSGEELDFMCPGHDILSCVPNNSYAMMSGTSMSTPFAVGCACLLLSYFKSLSKEKELNTAQDYIYVFKIKAQDLKDERYKGIKKYQGYGILYP